jgi:hypothetical protein
VTFIEDQCNMMNDYGAENQIKDVVVLEWRRKLRSYQFDCEPDMKNEKEQCVISSRWPGQAGMYAGGIVWGFVGGLVVAESRGTPTTMEGSANVAGSAMMRTQASHLFPPLPY